MPPNDVGEDPQEHCAVFIIAKQRLPTDPAAHDVVGRSGDLETGRSRHELKLSRPFFIPHPRYQFALLRRPSFYGV